MNTKMMTGLKTTLLSLAFTMLSAKLWAAAPEPDFLYKGNGNGTIQGWFTGWDGEQFADARRAIGPGDYGLVYAVDHVDNNVKWHPYKGYQVPETFSLAMYTDLSAVTNVAADKAVMVAVGGNSGNHATLYKMGDKVKLDYNGGTLETSLPAGGYHLYTVTYSPSAITLSVDNGDAVSAAGTFSRLNNGFQIGGVYGGVGSYSNPTGLPVAAVLGFNKALTAEEVAELAQAYPATTESSYSNGSYNTNGGRLFAGTINQNGFIEVKRGTLVVPAGAHYQVKAIGFGDAQGEAQGFGLELDGNMTITGTSSKTGNGGAGIKAGVEGNEGGFLGGEWEGVGTYNIRGTLSIPNSYMQLVYDANAQTYNIEKGGKLIVKGIQANKGAGNKPRSSHQVNVKNGGLLQVKTALSLGTINANIEEGGTLELTDTFDHMLNNSNLGGVTCAGKLKLTGTNWVMLPNDETKAANLAAIAEIENNISGTNGQLLMPNARIYTIGSISGTGGVRADYTDNAARTLKIVQSKDTTWSGAVKDDSNAARIINFEVDSANGSTLTMSGTYTGNNVRTGVLTVDEGGAVKLTKVWPTAGFNVNGTLTIEHGVWQPVYMVKGTGTINWAGTNTFSVNAADGDDALILEGTTINQTAGTLSLRAPGNRTDDSHQDNIGYIKNATITSSSTLSCSGKIGVKGACSITKTAGACSISTIELSEADATLVLDGVAMTVTSGVEGMAVREDTAGGVKTYSLHAGVANVGENNYETLEEAINASLGRPITLLANATGPAGCYLINANGYTFSVGAGLGEVHWTRTDGVMYKVTTTADATVGQKRVESNKYDTIAKFDGAVGVNVNALFIPATATLPKGSKVTIQSIGLAYRNNGYPASISLAGTTSISCSSTGTDTVRVGANNGAVRWVRYAFDDVEVTVGEEIAISGGTFDAQFTAVAETDTTALRKEQHKTTETLIYEIQYTVTEKPRTVATLWSTPFTTLEAAIAQAKEMAIAMGQEDENALLKDIVLTVPFTAQLPDGYELVSSDTDDRLHIQAVTTAAQYIVISPSAYVDTWKTYIAARAESPVAAGITFAVKAADEIYAAYPAKADNVNGDPRNDAESIHKYIGMMQAKGTKYFVLGGRFKDAWEMTTDDRATMIPGVYVHPKRSKATTFAMNCLASDLYYACHYVAEGAHYAWDPNGDKVYVGIRETTPDEMEDVRHFQPNCVVSRMEFLPREGETYADCIRNYRAKLAKGEAKDFAGNDKYVAWTAYCVGHSADGKPDVFGVMQERLNAMVSARAAREATHFVYLQNITQEQLKENTDSLYASDWEIFLPFGHGVPESFAGLSGADFAKATKITKFFMANVPCLTGQLDTNGGCAAELALSNPDGGSLVSINNTSYGYASPSGINQRHLGVSDELVDWCLDRYLAGQTAGEAWRYAIATFTDRILSSDGFKTNALESREHAGADKDGTPHKCYVFAAFLEQMLFGDPLVKIQTEPGSSSLVATVSHPAKLTYHSLPDALRVAATDSAANTIGLFRTANVDAALTVATEDVLEIESGKGLIAKGGLTVNGTLSGEGTISGAVTFGSDATLDASGASKLSLAAGSSLTVAESGVNLILPSGTTAIPAATTMAVMNQSDLTGTWKVASAKAAGSDSELSRTIELIAANDRVYVIDSSNLVKLDSIQTGKGAVIESVIIVNGEGETPAVMESKKYFLIPSGATIKVTYRPDLDHSGAEQTIIVQNVTSVGTVTGAMTGYENGRAPAMVFVDGDSEVTYTGVMLNKVLLPEGEATSGTYVEHRTSIVAGDTVVFDVAHHLEGKTVVVMADAAGAELHIDANLTMIPGEAAAILGGKRVDVQDGHTLTLKPTDDYDLTLGSGVSFNGGTVKMTTDNAAKFIKTDSLEGASLIDIRSPLVIKPPTDAGTIAWSGRLTGNGTIEGAVAVHAGAHLIVKGTEHLTVPNLTSHEHRLTIDAMASTPVKGGDGKYQPLTVLKVADKEMAEALIPNLTLVEPELTHADGKRVLFQLAATDDGSIVMKELKFVITEGFFTNGVLGQNAEVVWKHDSAFASGDYGISVTCPAEIAFDFTGAGSKETITVAKPITLSGSGALTFDVPTGRTVYVNCTISGNAGVTKTGGGTLIFGLPEGMTEEGGQEGENARAGWNTFYGALTVEEGTVRSTKGHGYGARHVVDGETDVPEIEIHSGATLDLAHICDQEMLEIITAGTITNSYHHATGATVGQIKQLTLKGDATVTGHTFGMARDSIINLQGHVLTISMERGECVTETIAPGKTEVRDHEFELNNTKVLGGRDNLATPDIIVRQGTLSCEGSTWDGDTFTMGDNDLLDAALYVGAEGCLRLDANLTVKRIQMVNGNKDVVVPCDENPDGTQAEAHTHTFKKVWEESLKPGADPTSDADNKYFGHIIIRQELKGGISAPRLTLGRIGDPTKSLHDADDDMNSPEIRRIVLDKGEYIDCQQEFVMTAGKIGSQFNVFFLDWTGESGARRIFHGWEKFSRELSLSEILNPYGVKPKADGGYRLMLGDWYPYGAYAFADDPVDVVNTLPLEDQNWAYAISLWPYVEDGEARPYDFVNTLITTITHLDGEPLYNPELNDGVHDLYDNVLVTTNGLLKCYCQRGDGKMDFVIGEAWIKQYMGTDKYYEYMGEAMYLGGNGTISKWLNAKGANGIERWQSYMLGLDPTNARSLPVLAVRKDVAPSVTKMVDGEEKTFVNVKIAGTTVYGYQYISPVYAIEELDPATMEPKVVNPGARNEAEKKHTPWQSSINFQVEVPTKVDAQGKAVPAYDHVKYFRVKVSFQGNDGITN